MAGKFLGLFGGSKKEKPKKEKSPTATPEEIDAWMTENGRQKNQWGNYSNKDMADFSAANQKRTSNEVANNRALPEEKESVGEQIVNGVKAGVEKVGNVIKENTMSPEAHQAMMQSKADELIGRSVPGPSAEQKEMIEERQAAAEPETPAPEPTPEPDVTTPDDVATGDEMVAEAEETAQNPTPEDVHDSVDQMVSYMQKLGLVTINEDGSIQFTEPKTPTSSTLARIGTIVSALACVASGGLIPAVNMYKLSGREDKDKLIYDQYHDLMSKVSTELGDVFGDYYRSQVDAETELNAGENRFASQGGVAQAEEATEQQLKIMAQQQKNVIEQMQQSNANSKDYAQYMAQLSANELPMAMAAARAAGLDLNDIARYAKSRGGITGWDDALNKLNTGTGILGNVVGTFFGGRK